MFRNDFLQTGTVAMSPRKVSETPSDVGSEEEVKTNPGLFALALSEHSGFSESLTARTMTPPPQYTRHEQPRLTILIPEEVEEEDEPGNSAGAGVAEERHNAPSTDASPVTSSSPSKQTENKLFLKVKAGVKRRGQGLRSRLRKQPASAPTTPSQNSPSSAASSTDLNERISEQQQLQANSLVQCISDIQELDSTQIVARTQSSQSEQFKAYNTRWSPQPPIHGAGFDSGFQRNASVSSIMPTPRRGLSLVSHPNRISQVGVVSSTDLTGRLESLSSRERHLTGEDVISPCSPASAVSSPSRAWSSLVRSNAITDRVSGNIELLSPISPVARSPSPPPTTPTLDGRLNGLPRLSVPHVQKLHSRRSAQSTAPKISPMPHEPRQFAELDHGKEVAVSTHQDVASGWYSSPSGHIITSHQNHTVPRIAVDPAEQAPELVHSGQQPGGFQRNYSGQDIALVGPPQRYTGRPYQTRSPLAALAGSICDAMINSILQSSALLQQAYGPEPSVPEGHVRVRWRCACGDHVYDDYIENRSGAAAELEAYLNKVPNQWPQSPPSSYPSSAADSIFSAGSNTSSLSSATTWGSHNASSPTLWDQQGIPKQHQMVASSNPYSRGLKSYIEPLWLYTCVNEGKWTTKMRHLDVNNSKINSDKDLALALGALHSQVNRKWYKLFKLRGLISIKFVQFELHRNRYADISSSPSLPTPGTTSYEFAPHDLTLPVGSHYLMHLFKHPYDYDDELITYLRTPKRRDRLEMGTGWGLQLVEGFLAERVWAAILCLAAIGSAVFAGCWARGTGDVQGAFGIAGWIVGIAGLVGAWIQAAFD